MTTPNLALVELTTNQQNPENVVNDGYKAVDTLVQPTVINSTTTAPPGSPTNGDRYIPAATATGAWAGKEDDIAYYYNGWYFYTPLVGWTVYDVAQGNYITWTGSAWAKKYVVGPASSTDNAIARMDSTSGKLIQDSGVLIDDNNALSGHYLKLSSEKTAAYEVVAADAGTVIVCNSGSAFNVTLDDQISTLGFQVKIVNRGAGTITVVKEGSDTLETGSATIAQYGSALAVRIASTVWAMY